MSTDVSVRRSFLSAGGDMGHLIRQFDWARTALGSPENWPQSLKTAVGILLNSGYPMYIAWGQEFVQIYNDAYRPILGDSKHPSALGGNTRDTFPEIWDIIGPMFRDVIHEVKASTFVDQLLPLDRYGFPEECYFVFSYSPVLAENGEAGGVFVTVLETTDRVLRERRQRVLKDLAAVHAQSGRTQIFQSASELISADRHDAPFAAICVTASKDGWDVVAVDGHTDLADAVLIDAVRRAGGLRASAAPVQLTTDFSCAPWPEPVRQVTCRPITPAGHTEPVAVLVCGISPRLPVNQEYAEFFDACALNIAALVADAEAFEFERSRAEALAQIDHAKTTFFSNVSHEFRTPLTLMLGPIEDALADETDARLQDAQRERLGAVHRNSLRLLKLVNSLLDFSRIEAGRMQAAFEPVDLAGFTADLVSNFRAATEKAGLDLIVDAPPLAQAVYIDRDMWEKVVLNLLSNAFKFTFEGAIAVQVRASQDGSKAEVSIRDTGVGIPPEELPRLFERFHRVEGIQGRSIEGSGIGLALVQELVRLQGGEITVESGRGLGSTFHISLPFGNRHLASQQIKPPRSDGNSGRAAALVQEALRWLPSESEGEPPYTQAPDVAARGQPASCNHSILVVDDNQDMRNHLRHVLEAQGYGVRLASSGSDALQQIQARRPDLVLADVMMPAIDGFGLLQALRGEDDTKDLPVILLSARAGEDSKIEGLNAGADDYIVKPFSSRELLARLASAIALSEARQAVARAVQGEAQRIRQLFDRAPGFIAIMRGPQHVFEFVNRAYVQLVGDRNLVGSTVVSAVPEAVGQGFINLLDNVYATGERFVGEGVPIRFQPAPDAPWYERVINFVYEPVRDDTGTVMGIFCEGHDITEMHLAQVALRESEERLQALNSNLENQVAEALAERRILADVVETTDAIIAVLDINYRFLALNHAFANEFERVYGAKPKAGDHILELLADRPELQPAVKAMWGRALKGEEFTAIDEFGDPNLDRRYYEMKFNALRDDRGKLIGAFQFVYDVTQRLRRDVELAHAQEALRQSQKMDAMGQLTGGVAHDFNNLLMPIIGSLDMLQRKSGHDARTLRMISGGLQAAERAKTLVQRLLAFARRQPLQATSVDVGKLIHGMADLVASTSGPRVRVIVEVEPDLPPAVADPNQLEMAVLNLAVNGRDAMPDGGVLRVTAHLERGPPAGKALTIRAYLCVSVIDTGMGMEPATLSRATEPFFSTKGIGKGTGLGLSMAHGLAAQLGGTLTIESEVGVGTKVEIWLPVAQPATHEGAAVRPTGPINGTGTALLVDDEDLVRASTMEMLTELGYEVIDASTAEEAAAIVRNGVSPDVLITDHLMPGMTGAELVAALREQHPGLPALIISGYADAEGLSPEYSRLTKPFRQAELAEALADLRR